MVFVDYSLHGSLILWLYYLYSFDILRPIRNTDADRAPKIMKYIAGVVVAVFGFFCSVGLAGFSGVSGVSGVFGV